jgi:cell division protein FtsA
MAKRDIKCGLSVGSGQIICVLGTVNPENGIIEIISYGQDFCRGIKGGVVIDIDETSKSITNAIEEAENKIKEEINEVYLGVRGTHIESCNSHGVMSISRTDKEITPEDVNSVIENTRAIQISNDREIIDILVQEFSLDRQRGVHNPVGMEGNFLEAYALVITASTTHLNNIFKSVEIAGFNVNELIYGLLAVCESVVTEEEKENGCLLIDLGGQNIGLAIYSEKSLKYTKEINFGVDLITRDISHALRTSLAQAKLIRDKYGVAVPSLLKENEPIEYTGVDGRTIHTTDSKYLTEIIPPRVEEIFDKIGAELQNTPYMNDVIPGGIIITGSGSLLKGMREASEKIFGIETRVGFTQGVTGLNEIITNPTYAEAIGLLKYKPYMQISHNIKRISRKGVFSNIISKLRDWM